jgi:hypothetical protein
MIIATGIDSTLVVPSNNLRFMSVRSINAVALPQKAQDIQDASPQQARW